MLTKKVLIGAAALVASTGLAIGSFAVAGAAGNDNTTVHAANNYYLCVAAGNKVANAYSDPGWHGVKCPSGQELYLFPSRSALETAKQRLTVLETTQAAQAKLATAMEAAALESSRSCTPSLCVGENPEGPQGLGGSAGWGWDDTTNAPRTLIKTGDAQVFSAEVDQQAPAAIAADGDITLTWNPQFLSLAGMPADAACTALTDSTGMTCHFSDLAHASVTKGFTFKARGTSAATSVNVTVDAGGQQATGHFPIAID